MLHQNLYRKDINKYELAALKALSGSDVRTNERIMSLVMKALRQDFKPSTLQDIYTVLSTRRNIIQDDAREKDVLLLRLLKNIHSEQYGFDERISKCVSLD